MAYKAGINRPAACEHGIPYLTGVMYDEPR